MMTIKEKFWFYLNSARVFRENNSGKVAIRRTLNLAKMYRQMLEK